MFKLEYLSNKSNVKNFKIVISKRTKSRGQLTNPVATKGKSGMENVFDETMTEGDLIDYYLDLLFEHNFEDKPSFMWFDNEGEYDFENDED